MSFFMVLPCRVVGVGGDGLVVRARRAADCLLVIGDDIAAGELGDAGQHQVVVHAQGEAAAHGVRTLEEFGIGDDLARLVAEGYAHQHARTAGEGTEEDALGRALERHFFDNRLDGQGAAIARAAVPLLQRRRQLLVQVGADLGQRRRIALVARLVRDRLHVDAAVARESRAGCGVVGRRGLDLGGAAVDQRQGDESGCDQQGAA
jgi:hypothetical protein